MKNLAALLVAFLIVYVVWHLVAGILLPILGLAFSVALFAIFAYAVYAVYRALTRQKSVL